MGPQSGRFGRSYSGPIAQPFDAKEDCLKLRGSSWYRLVNSELTQRIRTYIATKLSGLL